MTIQEMDLFSMIGEREDSDVENLHTPNMDDILEIPRGHLHGSLVDFQGDAYYSDSERQ